MRRAQPSLQLTIMSQMSGPGGTHVLSDSGSEAILFIFEPVSRWPPDWGFCSRGLAGSEGQALTAPSLGSGQREGAQLGKGAPWGPQDRHNLKTPQPN